MKEAVFPEVNRLFRNTRARVNDVNNLAGAAVLPEALAGRNFRHYCLAVKDGAQPECACLSELDLHDEPGAEDEKTIFAETGCSEISGDSCFPAEDGFDDWDLTGEIEAESYSSLGDLLPDDCWVKRFADDSSTDTWWLLYLVTDAKGDITDSGCLKEEAHRCSGSGEWLGVPGMERPMDKVWSYASEVPEKVLVDLQLLFDGEAVPLQFKFIGKPLPVTLKESMRPGATQCIFALPSTLRQAFSHMTVDLDELGYIRNLTFATWQRSGSSFGDLFYQPMNLADRQEEAMNSLLFLYDSYSEEEKRSFLAE